MRSSGLILMVVIANHLLLSGVQAQSPSSGKRPQGSARIDVEFDEDGVRITGGAVHYPSGSRAELRVAHRAPSADPTPGIYPPAPAPAGYWSQVPIVCPKCGKVKGYRQVWLRWCVNCQRYHE